MPLSAMELIHKQPVRWRKERVVSCDGGGGPLGHPKIYINLDKAQVCWCTYCGIPFVSCVWLTITVELANPGRQMKAIERQSKRSLIIAILWREERQPLRQLRDKECICTGVDMHSSITIQASTQTVPCEPFRHTPAPVSCISRPESCLPLSLLVFACWSVL